MGARRQVRLLQAGSFAVRGLARIIWNLEQVFKAFHLAGYDDPYLTISEWFGVSPMDLVEYPDGLDNEELVKFLIELYDEIVSSSFQKTRSQYSIYFLPNR